MLQIKDSDQTLAVIIIYGVKLTDEQINIFCSLVIDVSKICKSCSLIKPLLLEAVTY